MARGSGTRAASGTIADIASAIALAADLAVGQPFDHVLRSCAIAMRLAEHLGLSQEDQDATYWMSILLLPGCTAVSFELSRLFGDDIAIRKAAYDLGPSPIDQIRYALGRAGGDASLLQKTRVRASLLAQGMKPMTDTFAAHCSINARLAASMGLGPPVTTALEMSWAQWDGKGIPAIKGEDVHIAVRVARLADLAEVVHRERGPEAAVNLAQTWSGILFDPALVDAWLLAGPSCLEGLDGNVARDMVMQARPNRLLSPAELDSGLELLADYADLKSPWFLGHSRGVAALAEGAARSLGLPEADVATARQAGLVHDIGRTGVPNSIWDKAARLTPDEMERVRLHAYYTGRVLNRAGSLAFLSTIASAGHERVDGSGYPRAIAGETIPILGRILECADAYQAMREARPWRAALSAQAAARELRGMVRAGQLEGAACDAVLATAGHAPRKRPSAPAGLTPREIEVLGLAARGAPTKEVARRLGISAKTAGTHIERIYSKIGVSSRAEAALYALQQGLIS